MTVEDDRDLISELRSAIGFYTLLMGDTVQQVTVAASHVKRLIELAETALDASIVNVELKRTIPVDSVIVETGWKEFVNRPEYYNATMQNNVKDAMKTAFRYGFLLGKAQQ